MKGQAQAQALGREVELSDQRGGPLRGVDVDMNAVSDTAQTLAAMAIELRKVGAQVEEGADYLRITRSEKWKDRIIHAPMMDVRYLCMNTELAPFDDVRVRKALALADEPGVALQHPELVRRIRARVEADRARRSR